MTLASSNIANLNKDPKFHQDMQAQFFAANRSAKFYNSMFQADLTNGSQVKLINEPIPYVESTTGHDSITYGNADGFQETFTVTEGLRVNERVFDTDNVQASFDAKKVYAKNGLRAIYREMDKTAFTKLKTNSFVTLSEVDITAAPSATTGNLVIDGILAANAVLDNQGFQTIEADYGRRILAMDPNILPHLKRADNWALATEEGDKRVTTGQIQTYDGVEVTDSTINLAADTSTFAVLAKGSVAAGAVQFTVDGSSNEVKAGDTFVNDSKTFTILNVNEVVADTEYTILVDRPIAAAIADNASITITGRHTVYVPVSQGMAGAAVVQKNPQFEELRDPDYNATLVRSYPVMFDYFLPVEASRRVVHIPFKYRTIV